MCVCERESKYLFEDVFVSACVRVGVSKCVSVCMFGAFVFLSVGLFAHYAHYAFMSVFE